MRAAPPPRTPQHRSCPAHPALRAGRGLLGQARLPCCGQPFTLLLLLFLFVPLFLQHSCAPPHTPAPFRHPSVFGLMAGSTQPGPPGAAGLRDNLHSGHPGSLTGLGGLFQGVFYLSAVCFCRTGPGECRAGSTRKAGWTPGRYMCVKMGSCTW